MVWVASSCRLGTPADVCLGMDIFVCVCEGEGVCRARSMSHSFCVFMGRVEKNWLGGR